MSYPVIEMEILRPINRASVIIHVLAIGSCGHTLQFAKAIWDTKRLRKSKAWMDRRRIALRRYAHATFRKATHGGCPMCRREKR